MDSDEIYTEVSFRNSSVETSNVKCTVNAQVHERVERILSHKISKKTNRRQYLVKWLNYELETSTWEPEENLFCSRLIEEYWKNPHPNLALRDIVEDEMAKQVFNAGQKEEELDELDELEEPESGEVTSDESEEEYSYADEENFVRNRVPPEETQEAFNTRAFVKLGLAVSAIIVIVFILWTGSDDYYVGEFYRRAYEQSQQHHRGPEKHQEH